MIDQRRLYLENVYPWWNKFHERTILSCHDPKAWYAKMIGKKIKIKQFGTFGAWDEKNRWVCYWDLSEHSTPFNR